MYHPNGPYSPPTYRDYTTASILILLLYVTGWLPGLIFNCIKLMQASLESDDYDHVSGFGCLVALLIVCGIGPIALLAFAYFALRAL
jgi:hypothetical protein